MTRRWLMVVFTVVVLGAIFAGAMVWFTNMRKARLAELTPMLESTDPFKRIDAGKEMLSIDPACTDACMAMAVAYITLGRYDAVRDVLAPVIARPSNVRPRALAILIDSYLTEAGDAIARAVPRSLELTVGRVESLLAESRNLLDDLTRTKGVRVMAAMIEARLIETRAELIDLRITQRQIMLRRKDAGESEPSGGLWVDPPKPAVDEQLTRWRKQLAELHDKLESFIVRAARMDPNLPTPYAVLFRMALRRGDIDLARKAAGRLSKLPRLDRRLAGRTAAALLDLERDHGVETTRVDLILAQRLLTGKNLRGLATLRYTLARAALALRIGKPDLAQQTLAPALERYPGHPHATILLADSLIDRGHPDDALALLVALDDRVPTVQGRFAQARAHYAAGRNARGSDLLRQALELDAGDLPSLIALATSLASQGHITEAATDIAAAASIAPTHSAVIALQTQLLVEQAHHENLPERYRKTFADRAMDWRDASMAAAMVLDDTQRVAAVAKERLANDLTDVRALIARYWVEADPHARADVASIAVVSVLEQVDRDPLLWPRRPVGTPSGTLLPSPHELALELVEVALDHWPARAELVSLRADLRAVLGLADAAGFGDPMTPLGRQWAALIHAISSRNNQAVSDTLRALLTDHPWDVPAVMLAIRYDLKRGAEPQAKAKVDLAGRINVQLGLLARATLALSSGDYSGTLHDASMLARAEPLGSFVRYYAGGLTARAHLVAGSSELAVNVLENLAISSPMGRMRIALAAIDVLTRAERNNAAIAAVIAMTDDARISPRWLDRLFARAARFVPARRLVGMIDAMLNRRGDEPLLLVYKAQALIDVGDLTSANQALALALLKRPDAPRVLMLKASLHQALGQPDRAGRVYRALLDASPRAAMAARLQLLRRDANAKVNPRTVEAP